VNDQTIKKEKSTPLIHTTTRRTLKRIMPSQKANLNRVQEDGLFRLYNILEIAKLREQNESSGLQG
jgi:hypothetical protein